MNMMKYCPECYKELPPNSAACPFCGYKTSDIDDNNDVTPGVIKTPRVDSYIPPEQTALGLLLLFIIFWGINIAGTALPIFLGIGTKRNILIAAIASQVLTRVLIGIWAVEEISLKKGSNLKNKLGTFLLALIPIGDFVPALNAARTSIRKNRLTILSIGGIASVLIMSLVIFQTSDEIKKLLNGIDIKTPFEESTTLAPTEEVAVAETSTPAPTATFRPYFNGCRNPLAVSPDEDGDYLEVCGKITNFGVKDCESCPLGFYSFLKIEDIIQIYISALL